MSQHMPDAKRVEQERHRFQAALEEYLAALEQASSFALPEKKRRLLAAYAEFRYQIQGGTHCVTCRTPVRHTMTVEVRRANGTTANFAALCTRCLEGEKAQAQSVTLRVGPAEYETTTSADQREVTPARRKGRWRSVSFSPSGVISKSRSRTAGRRRSKSDAWAWRLRLV